MTPGQSAVWYYGAENFADYMHWRVWYASGGAQNSALSRELRATYDAARREARGRVAHEARDEHARRRPLNLSINK